MWKNCLKEVLRPVHLLKAWRYWKNNRCLEGKNVKIGMGTSIVASEIGRHCFIGDDCQLDSSVLGRRSYMNNATRIRGAQIGSFVSIGSQVVIGIGGHPINMVSTHPTFYANNKPYSTFADKVYADEYGSTVVGNDVWIGSNSAIMGDIHIGDGAIIGYGAVVTKDVPPYAIVGGVPARILKYRFSSDVIERLLQIRWWELSDDFLKHNFRLMHDPVAFIEYYDANRANIEKFRMNLQEISK